MIGEVLFTIGPFKVGTFGVMMGLSFLIPAFILEKDFPRKGLEGSLAFSVVLVSAIGGLIGGRVYYTIDNWDQVMEMPARTLLTASGIVWYGGLIGGALAVAGYCALKRISFPVMCDLYAPMLAFGQIFGRMGCLLAGDGDYGPPTDVAWAMAFPRGAVPTNDKVHPTPIYDMIILFAIFLFLWSIRKRDYRDGYLFGLYLLLSGIGRFFTEFYRINPKVALGLSMAQWISIGLVVAGLGLTLALRRPKQLAAA